MLKNDVGFEFSVVIAEVLENNVGIVLLTIDVLVETIAELLNDVGREVSVNTDAFDDNLGSDLLLGMVMELLVTDVGRVLLDDNVGTDALLGIVEELLVNDVGREVFESPGAFDDNTGDKELLVIISELFVNDVGREL